MTIYWSECRDGDQGTIVKQPEPRTLKGAPPNPHLRDGDQGTIAKHVSSYLDDKENPQLSEYLEQVLP